MNWKWRDYQADCFKSVLDSFKKSINKQLIVQATGLGKRSQAVWLAGRTRNSLFMAHNEELIDQAVEDFSNIYGFTNVGIIKGNKMELDKRFVVASPQTLYNRLSKISKDQFSLIQIDEAHRYLARTYYACAQHFNAKRLLWTATPNRLDGLSLMDLADEKTFEYNIIDGIRNGYLAELDGIRIKTEISLDSVSKKMGDFDERQLSNAVDIPQRNMLVVNSYQKYANERQFVAFCVDTQHAIHLAEYFRDRGIVVEIISSDLTVCPDRKGSINRFKTGRATGLINVNILTEGFDYYDVGAILMVRPTQSQTLYFQAIGRGTRVKTEEFFRKFKSRDCKILDFVDNTSRHKLVNSFELDRSLPAASKMFVTTEKRDKLIGAENDRREAKITTRVLQDEYVNLTALPKVNIFTSPKMHDPATDKQLAFLQSLGIYSDSDSEGNPIMYTKLMATELINSAPAEAYMVRQLLQWGFNPNGATVGQFMMVKQNRQIKERINGNRFLPKEYQQ